MSALIDIHERFRNQRQPRSSGILERLALTVLYPNEVHGTDLADADDDLDQKSITAEMTLQEAMTPPPVSATGEEVSVMARSPSSSSLETTGEANPGPEEPTTKASGPLKRRPYISASLNTKTFTTIDQLLPFLESISKFTFENMQMTAANHYTPFPQLFDPQSLTVAADSKGKKSVLDELTVDADYIELLIETDLLDSQGSVMTGPVRTSTGLSLVVSEQTVGLPTQ